MSAAPVLQARGLVKRFGHVTALSEADFDLSLREVFEEDAIEEETYPLRHDEIDLDQPIRDLVVPELPLVPLCADDCLGLCPTCGANLNDAACDCAAEARDPRWDALRALVIPDDGEHRPEPN